MPFDSGREGDDPRRGGENSPVESTQFPQED